MSTYDFTPRHASRITPLPIYGTPAPGQVFIPPPPGQEGPSWQGLYPFSPYNTNAQPYSPFPNPGNPPVPPTWGQGPIVPNDFIPPTDFSPGTGLPNPHQNPPEWFGRSPRLIEQPPHYSPAPMPAVVRNPSQTTSRRRRQPPPPYLDDYSPDNLASRPNEWRTDYLPQGKGGLSSFFCKKRSPADIVMAKRNYKLHTLLYFKHPDYPPISHNLLENPFDLDSSFSFLDRDPPPNSIDFYQYATTPPVHDLILYHPMLPWYVEITAEQSTGVTIGDVLRQIHEHLSTPIAYRDFYNVVLKPKDRERITMAFGLRTREIKDRVGLGMTRVDFLEKNLQLLGLRRAKHGVWEIVTRSISPM